MTPERFKQVRNVFEAALELPADARSAFVMAAAQSDASIVARVERMLGAHENTVTFLDGAVAASAELRTDPQRIEGRRLGPYEVLRAIGRGGMGTVYLARRADGLFEQQVAIKVVTPESAGQEVIERFEQERSILASLEHPNIARLYDGGSTEEGWPYFVLEYVEGKPIDQWCDDRKLDVSGRIRLFRTVCAAVQYAVERRVIHRDLKPGNILVTEDGTVKLLDFGIAKLVRVDADERTALATRTGMRMMTPEYASPEQIRGEDVTPLADLYSLGVVLYELVTGRRPHRLKSRVFHEIARVVCEVPVTRPSSIVTEAEERPGGEGKTITIAPGLFSQSREGTPLDLKRRLSGDLDGILLKTLEKDPRDRYRSIDQLSEDLERHLNGESVLAAKPAELRDYKNLVSKYGWRVLLLLGLIVALATGGIRVDWNGIAILAAVAAAMAGWKVATDREIGAKLAQSVVVQVAFTMVVAVLMIGGQILFAKQIGTGEIEPDTARWIGGGSVVATLIYVALQVRLWVVREEWAGRLIYSFRAVNFSFLFFLFLLVVNPNSAWRSLKSDIHQPGVNKYLELGILALFLLATFYHWLTFRRTEVRERGILFRGRLISWLNLERYEWMGTEEPDALERWLGRPTLSVLRMHVSRLFAVAPPIKIRLPVESQAEVEALLRRQLGEWPEPPSQKR